MSLDLENSSSTTPISWSLPNKRNGPVPQNKYFHSCLHVTLNEIFFLLVFCYIGKYVVVRSRQIWRVRIISKIWFKSYKFHDHNKEMTCSSALLKNIFLCTRCGHFYCNSVFKWSSIDVWGAPMIFLSFPNSHLR